MSVAQPVVEILEPPFGAVVARQISVWPFAARMQRLFLLLDPSAPHLPLRDGLLRAMQQAYFRSDGQSQTRCVQEAALAAHYVLKHHNRDTLPLDQVCASAAVAAVRGRVAFVGLAGDASAFAWRNAYLTGLHGKVRLARPLGLETDPRIALWCTALDPGDRLVLVCGAEGHTDAPTLVQQVLELDLSAEDTEQRLSEVLASGRTPGVLVVEPDRRHVRQASHLRLLPPLEPAAAPQPAPAPRRRHFARVLASVLGVAVLAALAAVMIVVMSPRPTVSPAGAPSTAAHHVVSVTPELAVRLGPSGGNVIDMAVGDDALYTLDVVESSVRAFNLDAREQAPLPDTLITRTGAPIIGTSRLLAQPIAIQYGGGGLVIVDQARAVVQVGRDRGLSLRTPQSSAMWSELGALGTDLSAHLFVLDTAGRHVLDYAMQNQRIEDPPRLLLDSGTASDVAFEHAAEILGVGDSVYLRFDDGTVRRFDTGGAAQTYAVSPPDGRPVALAGIAADRVGGLYLADAANGRVLQTTADGAYVRELRHPALGGLRQLKSSVDGRRLYGLVMSGILTFDVPDADPGD